MKMLFTDITMDIDGCVDSRVIEALKDIHVDIGD